MANFRNITQVEEITTFTDNDKLIVNSNGVVKQIGIDLIAGGVPDGGTAGQVLAKTSDANGEAEWVDNPKEVVYVNITGDSDNGWTADKTYAELVDFYNDGATILVTIINSGYTAVTFHAHLTEFSDTYGYFRFECTSHDFMEAMLVEFAADYIDVFFNPIIETIMDQIGSPLPAVSSSDAGKFLRVSANGTWVAEAIPAAEEVAL